MEAKDYRSYEIDDRQYQFLTQARQDPEGFRAFIPNFREEDLDLPYMVKEAEPSKSDHSQPV